MAAASSKRRSVSRPRAVRGSRDERDELLLHTEHGNSDGGLSGFLNMVQTLVRTLSRDQCNTLFGHIQSALLDITDMVDQQPYLFIRDTKAPTNEALPEGDEDEDEAEAPPAKRAKV